MSRLFSIFGVVALVAAMPALAQALHGTPLDAGYRDMYNLRFDEAHREFAGWQQQHPDDPLGPASDAAAYLFSEFNRLHILEIEFFADDSNFTNHQKLAPDPVARVHFDAQLARAKQLADTKLARDPNDANALLASMLTSGLRSDYLALIEKRNFAAVSEIKQGRLTADRLLAVDPNCYDAYLAAGIENYLLAQKAAPLRWILRLGGAQTDPEVGVRDLQLTADKGHYMRPYARLLLAVAAVRAKDPTTARRLLQDLAQDFPENTLYTKELARLQ
jgi:hypothetical protein